MLANQGNLNNRVPPVVTGVVPHVGGPQVVGAPTVLITSLSEANKIDAKASNGDEAGTKKQQELINSVGGSKLCKSATSAVLLGKGMAHNGGAPGGPAGMMAAPSQTKVIANG